MIFSSITPGRVSWCHPYSLHLEVGDGTVTSPPTCRTPLALALKFLMNRVCLLGGGILLPSHRVALRSGVCTLKIFDFGISKALNKGNNGLIIPMVGEVGSLRLELQNAEGILSIEMKLCMPHFITAVAVFLAIKYCFVLFVFENIIPEISLPHRCLRKVLWRNFRRGLLEVGFFSPPT